MSSQLRVEGDGPFVGLVVGGDEAPCDDSFSTLGLHSIFSEDDLRNASREEIQKQRRADADRQTRGRKSSSGGGALGKFIQESSSDDDEMDLKALLRKGSKLIENYSRMKSLHGSFTIRDCQTPPPRFHGNRWLESAGKSVSCRNLGYDSETEHIAAGGSGGSGSRRSNKSDRKQSTEQIVDQAIRLTKRSRSASPQPPPLMDVSGDSLMDASQKSGFSEAEDVVEASAPNRPMRRCKSIGGGGGGRATPLMSNRFNETRVNVKKGVQEATGRALNALVKQNSVTILNPSTPNSRKTMLSIGKSVSSRNLCLDEDSKSSLSPRRPKGMTRKSMSVRNFSAWEKEEFHFNAPLSPGKRPRNAMHVGARSKSVRNFSAWEREESQQPLGPLPLSPVKRSSRKSLSEKRETLPAAFNGRKFLSYSRSLSCKDLDSEVETTCTPTTVTTTSTETSPLSQHMKKQSSIRGLNDLARPSTPSTLSSNDMHKQSSFRRSITPQPVPPIAPTVAGETNTATINSNTPPSHNPPLHSSSESRSTNPNITTTRPSTPSPIQSPTGSSMSKSMSSFLKKRVENEKMSAAVEAVPASRRKLLAGGGRSNSARRMEDGRKARLSFGKSLSARNLTEADNANGGNLSTLPPVPDSPCLSSQLSVCQEESSKNGFEESVTGISLAGTSCKDVDGDTPGMDNSMPALSSLMDSSMPEMDNCMLEMDCSAPGMDGSTPGMDDSTPGMDSSMPGLSPMTPLKTPYACGTTRSSQGATLPVVGEERLTQEVSSPPLAHADSDAACASTDSVEDPYQTTAVESESESEEVCENDKALPPSPQLSPIREVGAKSAMSSRRSQSHRRLSVDREVKSPLTIRTSVQGSSLQAALKKSSRAATLDRKRSSTKSKSSSMRSSSHEVMSKQSHRKVTSHDSREERKSSYRKTKSYDRTPSQKRMSSHDSKPSQAKTTSHNSKNDRTSAAYKRTISNDSKASALRGSSHDHKPAPGKCKSQDGQRKQKRRSSLDRQSAVAARLSSQQESKPSSLKAALHTSNDKAPPGKRSSSVRRQSTSSRQRRESRSGRKEDRRPSNKLTKRESQKHMSASTPGSSRRRASTGPTEKKMSQSTHASSSRRRRSSRLQVEKTLSVTIHACEQSQSSTSFDTSKEMNVSNSSASRTSGSRQSRDRKKKQRSSRKLALQDPLGGSSTSTSEDKKATKQKRRPSSRSSLSKESEESRADSPNCVAEYSPGAKAPPSPAPSKQGSKEACKKTKRNSLSGGVHSSRRSLKWADRMDVGSQAARLPTGSMRMDHFTVGSEAARLATSLHDDDDEDSCGNHNERPSCSDSEDRSHCSWSTAEFSSVAWQE